MIVQEIQVDSDMPDGSIFPEMGSTSITKWSKSDVRFPLTNFRRRIPSTAPLLGLSQQDGQSVATITIRGDVLTPSLVEKIRLEGDHEAVDKMVAECDSKPKFSLPDLPHEVQGKILDFILGDMHSVTRKSTSLRSHQISSSMRHPRRKAVSNLALVSRNWREMVQERIYRHIKIKGTRSGLLESEQWFLEHPELTSYVRHIEFWVPVWGDKATLDIHSGDFIERPTFGSDLFSSNMLVDPLGYNYKLAASTATLSEIFCHIAEWFPHACIFTLEGGHCKKSNMIRHFPKRLFPSRTEEKLQVLPNIRTFAMRGTWNIMRDYRDWQNIQAALPNVGEWHCSYAEPRHQATRTVEDILKKAPSSFRSINICLDGMYSKDTTVLGSNSTPSSAHLCERLGNVIPQLENLSFTGKICECFWKTAITAVIRTREVPILRSVEIVVKSCCRQRTVNIDSDTGAEVVEEIGGAIADGVGISNLVFIKAFERLIEATVTALPYFPHLKHIRIRFIDLDSPCALLNPYWLLNGTNIFGIWNEEIVELLSEVRPDISYVQLCDGIEMDYATCSSKRSSLATFEGNTDDMSSTAGVAGSAVGVGMTTDLAGWTNVSHNHPLGYQQAQPLHHHAHGHHHHHHFPLGGHVPQVTAAAVANLYPKTKPLSIKSSSYRILLGVSRAA